MIHAHFHRSGGSYTGFSVSGHAGYAEHGTDIVCASVSSAVQLIANAITEILHIDAAVEAQDDTVRLVIAKPSEMISAQPFIEALRLHFQLLAEDYEHTIEIIG